MIILTTDTSEQNIYFIPRSVGFDYVGITDDQTNVTIELEGYTYTQGDYYDTFEAEFNLVENHFYDIVFLNGTAVVYKDKIFCTDQNISTFTVNENQYTSNSSTNEFIVYE